MSGRQPFRVWELSLATTVLVVVSWTLNVWVVSDPWGWGIGRFVALALLLVGFVAFLFATLNVFEELGKLLFQAIETRPELLWLLGLWGSMLVLGWFILQVPVLGHWFTLSLIQSAILIGVVRWRLLEEERAGELERKKSCEVEQKASNQQRAIAARGTARTYFVMHRSICGDLLTGEDIDALLPDLMHESFSPSMVEDGLDTIVKLVDGTVTLAQDRIEKQRQRRIRQKRRRAVKRCKLRQPNGKPLTPHDEALADDAAICKQIEDEVHAETLIYGYSPELAAREKNIRFQRWKQSQGLGTP